MASKAQPPGTHAHGLDVIEGADAVVNGETLANWTIDWWRAVALSPAGDNLVNTGAGFDPYTNNTNSGMFFLGGTFGGAAERTFTVPAGEPLLIPIVNIVDIEGPGVPGSPTDPNAINALIKTDLDQWEASVDWKSLNLSVDGKQIHVDKHDLVRSNLFTLNTSATDIVAKSIFGLPADVSSTVAESDGVWVALSGLPTGEHTISFGGTVGGFTTQVTDHILVT